MEGGREGEEEESSLLQVLWSDGLLLLLPQHKEFVQSSCMEESVVGHPVHLRLARVVVVKETSARGLATQIQELVDLLNGLEG